MELVIYSGSYFVFLPICFLLTHIPIVSRNPRVVVGSDLFGNTTPRRCAVIYRRFKKNLLPSYSGQKTIYHIAGKMSPHEFSHNFPEISNFLANSRRYLGETHNFLIYKSQQDAQDKDENKKQATFTYYSPKIRKLTNLFKHTNTNISFKITNTIQKYTKLKTLNKNQD